MKHKQPAASPHNSLGSMYDNSTGVYAPLLGGPMRRKYSRLIHFVYYNI